MGLTHLERSFDKLELGRPAMKHQRPAAALHPRQERLGTQPVEHMEQRQRIDLVGQWPEQGHSRCSTARERRRVHARPRRGSPLANAWRNRPPPLAQRRPQSRFAR